MNVDAPALPGKKCGNASSGIDGISGRKPDKYGNPYPKRDQCYITTAKTANSNKTLTKLILKKVILHRASAGVPTYGGDNQVGVLWYYFKDYSCPEVKIFSQYQDNLDVEIFPGGLIPVG